MFYLTNLRNFDNTLSIFVRYAYTITAKYLIGWLSISIFFSVYVLVTHNTQLALKTIEKHFITNIFFFKKKNKLSVEILLQFFYFSFQF